MAATTNWVMRLIARTAGAPVHTASQILWAQRSGMMEINRECTELVLFHQHQQAHPDDQESYPSREEESSAKS